MHLLAFLFCFLWVLLSVSTVTCLRNEEDDVWPDDAKNSHIIKPRSAILAANGLEYLASSCKDLLEIYGVKKDGLYYLLSSNEVMYQTYCDMTTAGGGWTLVASVHENNVFGKCTLGDRWSSQQGNNADRPDGDGNWANTVTFGAVEAATSDDYKNPGYFDITAQDVSVWHVPNDALIQHWSTKSFLRYHTETRFLKGNLYTLFKKFPVRYGIGSCRVSTGPTVPVVYDTGNEAITTDLFGPNVRGEFQAGYITFRTFNNEGAAMAICSGVMPTGCNTEHYCIGGGGYFPEREPNQCGDFPSFDASGYGTHTAWSASKQLVEAAVLIFYR